MTPPTSPQALARALLEAAEKATPGPWEFDGYQMISKADGLNYGNRIVLDVEQGTVYSEYSADSASLDVTPDNAAYIALANPSSLTALVTWAMGLEEALKPFAAIAEEIASVQADTDRPGRWAMPLVGDFRRARSAIAGKQP